MGGLGTIVAMGSAPGFSGRGIVRAAGAGAWGVLGEMVTAGTPVERRRGAWGVRLRLDGGFELPALALGFVGPGSYTGEDGFELLIPGNPMLVDRVLQRMLRMEGVRLATPGEFTARAYLNGRLGLEQAEGVAGIIAARSADELRAARRLLEGTTGARYRGFAEELLTLLALVEAGIDFTDQEDVVAIDARVLDERLGMLERGMRELVGNAGAGRAETGLAKVALVGEPNAGKSTLFNTLLGRPRAVTSPLAGTTRDVLREPLELSRDVPGAGAVELMDLPGLEASGGAEGSASGRAAQEAARGALAGADVVLHCDPSGRFEAGFWGSGASAGVQGAMPRVIRVRTKADLPGSGDVKEGETRESLAVCALDGWHLGPLRRAIADAATGGAAASADAGLVPRHRRAMLDAMDGIASAREMLRDAEESGGRADPAMLAEVLRRAGEALGDLTGRVAPDDVLGRIFATFCVGK